MCRQTRLKTVLYELMKARKVKNQSDFAMAIGMSATSMSSAINGKEDYLTDSLFLKIHKAYPQIDLNWLLTGEGEMLRPAPMVEQNNVNGDNINGQGVSVNKGSTDTARLLALLESKERSLQMAQEALRTAQAQITQLLTLLSDRK